MMIEKSVAKIKVEIDEQNAKIDKQMQVQSKIQNSIKEQIQKSK